MWKGVKKIISSNNFNTGINNPSDIANVLNNYFNKVARDIHSSIIFSRKKFFDYFPSLDIESLFVTRTDRNFQPYLYLKSKQE